MSDLDELRTQIEAVSSDLVRVLNARFGLALEIGRHKRGAGRAFRDPAREAELIARLKAINPGPMPDEALEQIMRIILDTSVALMESDAESPR